MNLPQRFLLQLGTGLFACLPLAAQQQFQGLCSRVKIEIAQELTIERIGFEAVLKVTNNDAEDPINQFSAALTFRDAETGEDASDRFFVKPPEFININRVDGTGIIGPTKQAIATWFIIPKITAGGMDPRGKEYKVGCNLAGYIRGAKIPDDVLFAIEDTITVKPEPQLEITYFQPRDVQGDDPFTPEVESPIPFTLGVLVKNSGHGVARKIKIDSKQPKIVENKNGLLLVARLLGARVQDAPLNEASLLVDLGDLNPGQVKKGAWDMITSLSGEFIEFKASYKHSDELGGQETSVIKSLDAHFIAREVINDEPGRDRILDFLADVDRDPDMIPDTLYETDGAILPVNYLPQATVSPLTGNTCTVSVVSDREGWVYMRLIDPAQASYKITGVVRSDGKVINLRNIWTNIRYRRSDNFKFTYLNLFDRVENGAAYQYQVTYELISTDTTPPVTRIRFSGDSTEAGGIYYITPQTQMFFTSEDENPVSIRYQRDGDGFRPALPFRINNPGTYQIQFFASDTLGNVEETKTATLVIPGAPTPLALASDEASIFPTSLLSIRPNQTPIRAAVPASALATDGVLTIHQGVVAWPRVSGVPVDPTPSGNATLTVSGQFVDYYIYRINGGAWSTERPVADPIELAGMSGPVVMDILARHDLGDFLPEEDALRVQWSVNPAAPDLSVAGVPATPSDEAVNVTLNVSGSGSSLYRWSLGESGFFQAETPFTTPISLLNQSEGQRVIRLITNPGGVWPDETDPASLFSRVRWNFDSAYGFDLSELDLVRTVNFPNTAGQQISFAWDGRNQSGVELPPGPYTAVLTLTDALGKVRRAATLVVVEGLATQRTVLAAASGLPKQLQTSGNQAVWQQRVGSVWNIFSRDLSGNDPALAVTASDQFDQENPATDGRHVVWQSRQANGATDLFLASFAALSTHVQITDSPNLTETNPAVEWPWVVYQVKSATDPSAPWQIEAFNVETLDRFRVLPGQGDQFRPQIHGGRIVWEDHRDVGPGEVYFADLESGESRRITFNTLGQNNPDIFGDLIVWQDNRDAQVDIYGFDLRKGVEQRITSTTYNEINPRLFDSWLIYQEDSLGAETENLVLRDVVTGSSIALTRSPQQHESAGLGNSFAAWVETRGGSRTIVAARLPGLQPVNPRANALAVSQGLVDRYASAFDLLADWGGAGGIRSITHYQSLQPLVAQTATLTDGVATGDDFPLTAGSFLWAEFDGANMLDLGPAATGPLALAEGLNVFSHTGFPVGMTASRVIDGIGAAKLRGIRLFDSTAGLWRSVEIDGAGRRVGPDFVIPRVATLLIDVSEAATLNPDF
jgi:beta propeller repeat protein